MIESDFLASFLHRRDSRCRSASLSRRSLSRAAHFLEQCSESAGRGSGRGPGDDILLRQFPISPLKKSRWPGNLQACLAAELVAPIWIGRVRLRSFGSTDRVTEALREGVVSVTVGSPEGTILDALSGGDLQICSGFVNKPPLSMIAQPRYRALTDLRGARLGTSSLKEGTCHLMERMLAAHDLHQPKEAQFELPGAHPQRWKALQAGTLDAAIQLVPFNYMAEEAGFSNLGDVDEFVPDFLFCAVCTRLSWANAHAKQLTGLLRALPPWHRSPVRGSRRRGSNHQQRDARGRLEHTRRACGTSSLRRQYRKIWQLVLQRLRRPSTR